MADNSVPTLLIFCGPSGSGKTTIIKRLIQEFPNNFKFSVSHTTRKPRQDEENGVSYYFVSESEMQKDIEEGKFIEHATYNNNLYGTSKAVIEEIHKCGKIVLLDVEVQGVKQIRNQTSFKTWCIFVEPPSLEVLRERLSLRLSETEENLRKRLAVSKSEIDFARKSQTFDLIIVNDDFEVTLATLKEFIVTNVLHEK